jgi:type III pantothenate kinase
LYTYVDIGNTRIKVKRPEGKVLSYKKEDLDKIKFNKNEKIVLSSVTDLKIKNPHKFINKDSNFSFKFKLKGVGVDRLLACEGALNYAKYDFVVIDFGSAITVDFFDYKKNQLLGGLILPGFNLNFLMINNFFPKLPKVRYKKNKILEAKDTENAILNGVSKVISKGIDKIIIDKYGNKDFEVFVTGGDSFIYKDNSILNLELKKNLIFKGMENVTKKEDK